MPVSINKTSNDYMVPPGGFPYEMSSQIDAYIEGFIPSGTESISALVACVNGSCNVHAAIFTTPSISGGSVGELVQQEDLDNLVGIGQTLTLTCPTVSSPMAYIYRLWFDAASSSPIAFSGFTGKYRDSNAIGVASGSAGTTKNINTLVTVLVGSILLNGTPSNYITSAAEISSLSSDSLGTGI